MEPKQGRNNKLIGVIGLVVIVAAVGIGLAALSPKTTMVSESSTPAPTISSSPAPSSSPATAGATTAPAGPAYKDGTYAASGSYKSPGGTETVNVSLTVKGGIVTDSTVTTSGNNPTGKMYQAKFISGYKSQVTGKSLDQIQLSKVSGSSLTPQGFNSAVDQIKSQAQA